MLHVGGQALILASQLLNTPLDEEMKILVSEKTFKAFSARSYILFGRND